MSNKIKFFLGFLALIAFFSVLTFLNSFKTPFPTSSKNLTGSVLEAVDQDTDNDGLANREESYWNTDFQNPDTDGDGFLDGEEVASGHDPLKPGPNDLLDKSENITESLSDLMIAGLYAKDLKPGVDNNKYDKAVNDLSLAVIEDFYKTQENTFEVPLNLIGNTAENQKTYLEYIAKIIKDDLLDFPQKINLDKSLEYQSEFFINKSRQYKKASDDMSKIAIPRDWEFVHRAVLNILDRLSLNYLFIGSHENDPMKSLMAINEVQNIDSEIKFLLQQFQTKIKQNNLTLSGDFYDILNVIYK